MQSERVVGIVKTLTDTLLELEAFKVEDVKSQSDIDLHEQLMYQLIRSIYEIHEIFFKFTMAERMAIITRSRELRRERMFSRGSGRSSIIPRKSPLIPIKPASSRMSNIMPIIVETKRARYMRC